MSRLTASACLLLAAGLLFGACSLTEVAGGQEIEIVAGEGQDGMFFEPEVITVETGQKVTFVIKNQGSVDHEFESVEEGEAGIEEMIVPPGRTRRVNWTAPDEPAEFPVYCDLPGHRAAGMELTLKVVPKGGGD